MSRMDGSGTLSPRVLLGLALLCLPLWLPLFTAEQLGGHDTFLYMWRLVEFHENIRHGILLPRWAPDLSSGFGQPLFLFNPPLFYYLAEVWHLAGLGFMAAVNMACVTLIAGSAVAMFLLGAFYFGRAGGILAAAAYLYAPYFLVDLYVRQALAEFTAFPFYPLALYGLAGYARQGHKRFLLAGAAGYAGVLLAHNPAALLFSPLVAAFGLFNGWRARSWRVLQGQAATVLLGLGAAAFVWLPILAERHWVNVDRLLENYLRYANHFVYPRQFFLSPWGYGLSLPGPADGMSFTLGWSHLILLLVVAVWARKAPGRVDGRWLGFFFCAAVVLCLLMTSYSDWIWSRLPLLQYVEFPWRLLAPATVCVALLVAPLAALLEPMAIRRRKWLAGALALLILPNLSHAQPPEVHPIDPSQWAPEQMARRGIRVTTVEEYEPVWVKRRAPFRTDPLRVLSGDAELLDLTRSPVHWEAKVSARLDSLAELALAYFPGWSVSIDGREVPVEIAGESGLIRFAIPAGGEQVIVHFGSTWPRRIGGAISLLSILVLGALGVKKRPAARVEDLPPRSES
ncbi:MAG: hypothetical protein HYX74_12020 [Acidobacteria bacterium]|nr:hypothetical protein [Acidobacteriota bacterium]